MNHLSPDESGDLVDPSTIVMYIMGMDRFNQFQNLTITRIRKLLRYINELINRRMVLDKLGITYEQFPLLMITTFYEGCTMQQIAGITNQHKSGILRGLRGLELRGLVRLKNDPSDLRKRLVFSTPKGLHLSEKILTEAKAFERGLFSGIPASEMRVFCSVLERVTDQCIASGATRIPRFGKPGT